MTFYDLFKFADHFGFECIIVKINTFAQVFMLFFSHYLNKIQWNYLLLTFDHKGNLMIINKSSNILIFVFIEVVKELAETFKIEESKVIIYIDVKKRIRIVRSCHLNIEKCLRIKLAGESLSAVIDIYDIFLVCEYEAFTHLFK